MNMLAETATLPDRIAEARAAVEVLERASGAAILDGLPLPVADLNAARANLEALEAAELEEGRRHLAAMANDRAVEHAEARLALKGSLGDYMAALALAESAAAALVDAFKDAEQHAGRMRGYYRVLGRAIPNALEVNQMTDDHSRMLRTKLLAIATPMRFGCMKWHSAITVPDWLAQARKALGTAIQPIIEGT